jgi:hypothetical protein
MNWPDARGRYAGGEEPTRPSLHENVPIRALLTDLLPGLLPDGASGLIIREPLRALLVHEVPQIPR